MTDPFEGEGADEARPAIPRDAGTPAMLFGRLVIGLGGLGTMGIFAMMILINADVLGRLILSSPLPGVPEMVAVGVVAVVYLQLGQSLAGGRFTRSGALLGRIEARWPRLGAWLRLLFDLTGAALMLLIFCSATPRLVEAVSQGYYIGHRGVFVAPRWPVDLAIVIGCAVTSIQFLLMAWRELYAMRAGTGR